jgi:striatin 1/3/4
MRRIKMLEYALRVERLVPILSSALSMDVTCLFDASSSKQLSQLAPLASQSALPAKVASLQPASQKDETSSHKEGSSPSSPRSEGISLFYSSPSLADAVKDSPLPPERGPNGTSAAGSTRASAWAGPSSSGWTNTNGPASTAAIGKPSLGRDPKSRARSRDYLKQYAIGLKKLSIYLRLPDACKRYNISLPLKR